MNIDELIGRDILEETLKLLKNDTLNSILEVGLLKGNEKGKYFGIPFLVKDNIVVEGFKATCASKILENYSPPYTATAVKRLLNAGFSVVGKTNLDEFAMGSSNENSAFGPVKNPVDTDRIPGGSSGGSAAAVSAGYVPFALGSDTGGSVRLPASFCGVVGYKPSYGLISRYGLVAFASSLDQIGPITTNVKDAALITQIMMGKDPLDSTTVDMKMDLLTDLSKPIKEYKIAYPKFIFKYEMVENEVLEIFEKVLETIKNLGARVTEVDLEFMKYAVAVYYIIAPAEASSNLARFDGVRYGVRKEKEGLKSTYKYTRDYGFGLEVKRRIFMGNFTLSTGYYEAYYNRAMKVRRLIYEEFKELFEKYDALILPTSPVLPPKIGEIKEPLQYYLMDMFTIIANLGGLPAISIPAGEIKNLPVGIQIMGKQFDDAKVLQIANNIEFALSGGAKDE